MDATRLGTYGERMPSSLPTHKNQSQATHFKGKIMACDASCMAMSLVFHGREALTVAEDDWVKVPALVNS